LELDFLADADRVAEALRFRALAVLREERALAERDATARLREDDTAVRLDDLARLELLRQDARRDLALARPADLRANARPRLTLHPTER